MDLARYASPKPAHYPAQGYGYSNAARAHRSNFGQLIITILSIVIAVCIGLTILRMRHPDVYYNITLSMDVFGITQDADLEKKRINKITLLPISDEKKEFLIGHSIFMGATPNMVKLALGEPRKEQNTTTQDGTQPVLVYIYHFPQDSRPTLLMFEQEKLVAAQKSSVTDVSYSISDK